MAGCSPPPTKPFWSTPVQPLALPLYSPLLQYDLVPTGASLGCDQLLKVPDGVIRTGRGGVKENGKGTLPIPAPTPGFNYNHPKTKTELPASCQASPRSHSLLVASGYLHLTRTFFPRRSLQTTSIILAGAAQSGYREATESGLQGSPRHQDPQLLRLKVHVSITPRLHHSPRSESPQAPSSVSKNFGPQGYRGRRAAVLLPSSNPPRPRPTSGSLKTEPSLSQAGGSSKTRSHPLSPTPDSSTWPPHLK